MPMDSKVRLKRNYQRSAGALDLWPLLDVFPGQTVRPAYAEVQRVYLRVSLPVEEVLSGGLVGEYSPHGLYLSIFANSGGSNKTNPFAKFMYWVKDPDREKGMSCPRVSCNLYPNTTPPLRQEEQRKVGESW